MMQYKENYENLKGINLIKQSVLLYFSLNSECYSKKKIRLTSHLLYLFFERNLLLEPTLK